MSKFLEGIGRKLFTKRTEKSLGNNNITLIGNDLLSCGNLLINQNDKYKFLKSNSDVRRCNDYIAKKIGIGGILLQDQDGNHVTPEEQPEAYEYVNRLFRNGTYLRWKKQLMTNTNISGENFFQPIRGVANGGRITRFETIDTRSIVKTFNNDGSIREFTVVPLGYEQSQRLSPDEVGYYIYEDDPNNPGYGFGIVDGIIFDILGDREAGRTNYYTFQNNGIPGAVFTLENVGTDMDKIKNAAEDIKNKFGGTKNVNKIAASPFIKDVKVLNISNKDLEYISGRKFGSEKIASAFGLHLKLIGYQGDNGSFSEIREIRREIYESTIIGFESYVENIMNDLVDKFQDELEIDLTQYRIKLVSENFEDKEKTYESQREDFRLGLKTPNEILTERGLPEATDTEYGNSRYISNNLNRVGEDPESIEE